jgi:N-acetylmuramoyl-L-alanine amidase
VTATSGIRVIVIDPGHGGIDTGATHTSGMEKDLTLALARQLRTALQARLKATVLLTRDADVALSAEARAAVANNNQAGLLIGLHTGYSPNDQDSGSSVFVMNPRFTGGVAEQPATGRLFLPWHMAYRLNQSASEALALQLQQSLSQALPGWRFPLRRGPMAVLASATMPAVAVELGNMNNAVSVQTLADAGFQARVTATLAAAIEQFMQNRAGGRP